MLGIIPILLTSKMLLRCLVIWSQLHRQFSLQQNSNAYLWFHTDVCLLTTTLCQVSKAGMEEKESKAIKWQSQHPEPSLGKVVLANLTQFGKEKKKRLPNILTPSLLWYILFDCLFSRKRCLFLAQLQLQCCSPYFSLYSYMFTHNFKLFMSIISNGHRGVTFMYLSLLKWWDVHVFLYFFFFFIFVTIGQNAILHFLEFLLRAP